MQLATVPGRTTASGRPNWACVSFGAQIAERRGAPNASVRQPRRIIARSREETGSAGEPDAEHRRVVPDLRYCSRRKSPSGDQRVAVQSGMEVGGHTPT